MKLTPEEHAAVITVAGKWALGMATAPTFDPETRKYEPVQPSQISGELTEHFHFAYEFLTKYLTTETPVKK
jgi:hypothetical protein